MYAFLNMPEYAPLQWHPFTICSGQGEPTVDFLISAAGDWTRELAERCLSARTTGGALPRIAIDGPFTAPTQSALHKKIVIAVGAGVGITPFLSLMSTILSVLEGEWDSPLVEAHFFWMARSSDEFLFGKQYLSKIMQLKPLRQRIFVHLHTTARVPEGDPAAYLFREAIARQSKTDRTTLLTKTAAWRREQVLSYPQLPWCWVAGVEQDVLWVSDLIELSEEHEQTAEQEQTAASPSCAGEWSTELMASTWRPATFRQASKQGCVRGGERMGSKHCATSLIPVVFGRPDLGAEVRSIGKARPGIDVDVYVCGNDGVVKYLQDVCAVCNQHAARDSTTNGAPRQKYRHHFERFG